MTPPILPPETPPAPAPTPGDTIRKGVLRAIVWQICAIIISAPLFFTIWGLLQWLALIPNFIIFRRKGFRLAAKGLLITGFVGILLNTACAVYVLGGMGGFR